jgi:hypothetical protein
MISLPWKYKNIQTLLIFWVVEQAEQVVDF